MELRINSPAGGDPVIYPWPLTKFKQYDPAGEIMETIRFVMSEYSELKEVMEKVVKIKEVDTHSYEPMKSLCDKFSKAADTIRSLWKGSTRPNNPDCRASKPLLRHIVQQVYNRSVLDPEKLNHYPAFSPETYGETTFEMVSKILEEIKPTEKDVFVDLGSGVGQVVVHVAGGSKCKKCIGIEKAEIPCSYAENMQIEFVRWMKWYGKKYRPFELKKGNFLDPEFRQLILQDATIIFVNNYAFGPELDQELKLIFQELKPHTKIVSSKSFCTSRSDRLTHRHMTDLSGIMDVRELTPVPSSVSWTCTNVTYYLHTVNPCKLEKYFFIDKNKLTSSSEDIRRSSSKCSSKSSSRDSSRSRDNSVQRTSVNIQMSETEEKIPFGPTTRRQWSEWVTQQEKVKKELHKKDVVKPSHNHASDSSEMSQKKQCRKQVATVVKEEVEEKETPILQHPNVPGEKKPGPGRPRKSQAEMKARETKKKYKKQRAPTTPSTARSPTKHDEFMKQLGVLHQWTVHSYAPGGNVEQSPGDVRVSSLSKSHYPYLDVLLDKIRQDYEKQLDYMQTEDFRNSVLREIQEERERRERLKQRTEHLNRQVKTLQEDGVRLLKLRMTDLNIMADTPAELLNQSKEIVLKHKELQNEVSRLGAEVAALEHHNHILVGMCRERDEQTVHSGILQTLGFPGRLTVETAKEFILGEIGMHFTRQRALLSEVARMEGEVVALQTNIPPALLPLIESPISMGNVIVQSQGQASTSQSFPGPPPVQTTQALAPSTAHRASKRGRTRGGSSGPPRKRLSALTGTGGGRNEVGGDSDPKKQEEIERQIQDIVQKALSVDNAAKSAEKERKAKNADRKKVSRVTAGGAAGKVQTIAPPVSDPISGQFVASLPDKNVKMTFTSPGLVPVFTTGSSQPTKEISEIEKTDTEGRQRNRSGSSTETESAPSDQEVGQETASHHHTPRSTHFHSRPSSVPVRSKASDHKFSIASLVGSESKGLVEEGLPRVRSACPRIDAGKE